MSQQVTVFTRQLATLLRAEVPLLRGLEMLARQARGRRYRQVLQEVIERVRGGGRFSQALASHPRLFDPVLLNMVRAGEASGSLADVLARVATHREKARRVLRRLQAAMVYPMVVLIVAGVIVALLMALVIPQFEGIYADTLGGRRLPFMTEVLVTTSAYLRKAWWFLVPALVPVAVALRIFLRCPAGALVRDRILFRLPGVRGLIQRAAAVRFARTLGSLLDSGVPLLEALLIARGVVGNAVIRRALLGVHAEVRDGASLARAVAKTEVFPPLLAGMLAVGEETGRVGPLCARAADACEEELDAAVGTLAALLEPVLIVFLALVVGSIVVALFLPLATLFQVGGMR